MKKLIAIATWVRDLSLNYGSALQTTAMQKLLRDCGCKPITIRHHFHSSRSKDLLRGITNRENFRYFRTKYLFSKWFCHNTELSNIWYIDNDVIKYIIKRCNLLLCGSDSIWCAGYKRPFFFGDYAELSEYSAIAYAINTAFGDIVLDPHLL